jgi:hypothetical protein
MMFSFQKTVFTPLFVQEKSRPIDGLQRKNAATRISVPRVGVHRSLKRAAAHFYFQFLKISSKALSNAVFRLFSIIRITSASRMDYCFFFRFSFSRSLVEFTLI